MALLSSKQGLQSGNLVNPANINVSSLHFAIIIQVQQLRAVEASLPLHREVALVARRLAAPLGGDRRNGRIGRGRGLLGGGRAARLADWRAGASGAVNDHWPIGHFTVHHFFEQIQVTNKGELQVEEDAFRNFSDIARNNQARTDTEAEFSNVPDRITILSKALYNRLRETSGKFYICRHSGEL